MTRATDKIEELKENETDLILPARSFRATPGPNLPPRSEVEKLAQVFHGTGNYETIEKGSSRFEQQDFESFCKIEGIDEEKIDAVVVFNKSQLQNAEEESVFDRQVVNELPSVNPMNAGKGREYKVPTQQK